MIKIENVDVWGFEHAIRGMRNPMNSWNKIDSRTIDDMAFIGNNDLTLMRKLFKAGTEHRKYLRQIFISMDITAPLYWWKEFDTYKVGTVANSCSTMHTIMNKAFEESDFSFEHVPKELQDEILNLLNDTRSSYATYDQLKAAGAMRDGFTKKDVWYCLIQLLPSSYNQKRTVTMNYENVVTIINQRFGHKLDEWNTFVEELKALPYIGELYAKGD